ncbi:RNA polymerase sigma factor [Paenibacillus sp. MSJ-34]|uniref:RNA polymerase sigma factor n=1 Tax=Paenibacillus sp. MSJ-34 TaxID=2841529 RepID=UPI0020A0EB40|nr:RNA polymerase sigma factor [Paenibacillus sp. MSJ-34]
MDDKLRQRLDSLADKEREIRVREASAPEDLSEADDGYLVRQAQSGNRQAFGELVRRHRSRIYGYAQTITHEPFMAEDIVQDALTKAFLHLGRLSSIDRFLPWLHRIVRNQAYTKLRSGAAAKERAFTALRLPASEEPAREEGWRDMDFVLRRLSRSLAERKAQETDPEARLMRSELVETIIGMLRCLNKRERRIFEAHFFEQLSPQEISKLFQLSSANVYQLISRSRKKVVQENIRIVVDQYVQNRKEFGQMKKTILPKHRTLAEMQSWLTAPEALYAAVQYTDRACSLPLAMGLTGQAFRIGIFQDDVHIAGPTAFDFAGLLTSGLRNLGFDSRYVSGMKPTIGQNSNLADPAEMSEQARERRKLPDALPEALELIHRSIDRGYPVVAWDLFIPEFGVIYGYDDEQRRLLAVECAREDVLPYEHLGRGMLEDLFVIAIEGPVEIDKRTALRNALQTIMRHYDGEEERIDRCVTGLAAYETWREACRGGRIEPNGNSYNISVLRDARRYAAAFLEEASAEWLEGEAGMDRIREASREAAALYREMSVPLDELQRMFPFPEGGRPNDPAQAERAAHLLQSVESLERQAVALLRHMYAELDGSS